MCAKGAGPRPAALLGAGNQDEDLLVKSHLIIPETRVLCKKRVHARRTHRQQQQQPPSREEMERTGEPQPASERAANLPPTRSPWRRRSTGTRKTPRWRHWRLLNRLSPVNYLPFRYYDHSPPKQGRAWPLPPKCMSKHQPFLLRRFCQFLVLACSDLGFSPSSFSLIRQEFCVFTPQVMSWIEKSVFALERGFIEGFVFSMADFETRRFAKV